MTNPAFPGVRAIDAFDPEDPAISWIRASGVTASQILPGSGNVMGGQALAVKYRGAMVRDMAIVNAPVALKFACGENPKNTYGSRGLTPMSRMGIGYVMRDALGRAKELLLKKRDYCAHARPGLMPTDLNLENLVSLLQGHAVLNIHCYKVVDFEMALRVAKEFEVKIAAFHHAIEAWKIPDLLAENDIAVALFSDLRGYKVEAFRDSVYGPRLLNEKGVKVIFKTDHPVVFGWELLAQAQKAAHWGLPNEAALQAVTSLPTARAGFGHLFGSLQRGFSADLVLWDRHPLRYGAKPQKVFVDGEKVFENPSSILRQDQLSYTSPYHTWKMETSPSSVCASSSSNANTLKDYAVTNAQIMTGDPNVPIIASGGSIIVTGGVVTCVGTSCSVPNGFATLDMKGGVVTPGHIAVGMPLGNVEIDQEQNWQDGPISGGAGVSTLGGVQLQTTHTRDAWADGMLVAVSRPASSHIEMGSSSSFWMGPSINFMYHGSDNASYVIMEYASIDMQVGNSAKRNMASVSEQIASIKSLGSKTGSGQWKEALAGAMPIVVWANSADYIIATLNALEVAGFDRDTTRIIIGGAAEAHLVVPTLKRWSKLSIIFRRCGPDGYETRRCDNDAALKTFLQENIPVGLAQTIDGDMSKIRGLRWNAGLLLDLGYTPAQALATVSYNLAKMYNLGQGVGSIQVGSPANWVAFNGNPLDTTSIIEALGVHDKMICRPEQN